MNARAMSADGRVVSERCFSWLGDELGAAESSVAVLTTIAQRASNLVPSAEHAGVTRRRKHRFETVATSSARPPRIDQIQYRLGSGPGVDAIAERSRYRSGNLATDYRWPEFGREAASRHGIHSVLSIPFPLPNDELPTALNLYSTRREAFDEADETAATLLATHGALALIAARRLEKISNLELALNTSRQIGAAVGILMATRKVTEDQAFDLLRAASQTTDRRLNDIADDVVRTGTL